MVGQNHLKLKLIADLHGCDCGAPDCYGTFIEIDMFLLNVDDSLFIRSANVKLKDFNNCSQDEPERITSFEADLKAVNGERIDLYDPDLRKLVFINKKGNTGIVISPQSFVYYDTIKPGMKLEVPQKCGIGIRPANGRFTIADKYQYTIQVIGVSDENKAREYFKTLFKKGFKTFVRKIRRKDGFIYQIRVGRGTKEDMVQLKRLMEEKYAIKNTWIVKGDGYFDQHLMELKVDPEKDWESIRPFAPSYSGE